MMMVSKDAHYADVHAGGVEGVHDGLVRGEGDDARVQGVHHIRVVGHGSSDEGYNGMRQDVMGATLVHSGRHGQIKGHGQYIGLCDLAPTSFNNKSSEPNGSMILELWATQEKIQPEEGHYTCWRYMDPVDLNDLNASEVCGTATVVRENNYVLPLGLVRAR